MATMLPAGNLPTDFPDLPTVEGFLYTLQGQVPPSVLNTAIGALTTAQLTDSNGAQILSNYFAANSNTVRMQQHTC